MEDKINKYVDLCLKKVKLPFRYSKVTVESCEYYGPNDYYIELLFHEYNGGKYPHRNKINCVEGSFSQIMFLDRGFPNAALCFDRELIPDNGVKLIVEGAKKYANFDEVSMENPQRK